MKKLKKLATLIFVAGILAAPTMDDVPLSQKCTKLPNSLQTICVPIPHPRP